MNAHNTVVDLSTIAIPLAASTHRMLTALGCARFVQATDRLGMCMVFGDNFLTAVSELFFIPLDRFEKTLQRPWRRFEFQGDGLGRFTPQI